MQTYSPDYQFITLKLNYAENTMDTPCVWFTACLQQRQKNWIMLIATIVESLFVQIWKQFNTLKNEKYSNIRQQTSLQL